MLCFYFFFFGDPELESIFFSGWQRITWSLLFISWLAAIDLVAIFSSSSTAAKQKRLSFHSAALPSGR
jgi:hypothetical protein